MPKPNSVKVVLVLLPPYLFSPWYGFLEAIAEAKGVCARAEMTDGNEILKY
jgi:hypothetical protein